MNQKTFISSNKRYSNNGLALLYIITIAVAFTTKFGDINLGYSLQLYIGFFWICVALLNLFINNFKFKGIYAKDYSYFIKLYFIPHLIIHLYSVMLMCLGKVTWEYFTTNATVYVPSLLAILSIYLFGTRAFKFNCIAFFISWVFSVGYSLIFIGPGIFYDAILQGYLNGSVHNYLELHDLVLAAGYIVVYYMYLKTRYAKRDFFVVAFVITIMLLGIKRVSAAAIILILLYMNILRRLKTKNQYKINILLGIIIFLICYGFIYIIFSGDTLYQWLLKYGIDLKGRNYYYNAIMSYVEFKPSFIGLGRNAVTRLLSKDFSYFHVGGVHSDIIKMYAENGFIMFGLWLWYYLIYLTKAYKKHYGYNPAILYFLLTIYTFMLYSTDNIEVYFVCQIFSIVIPVTYTFECKKKFLIEQRV